MHFHGDADRHIGESTRGDQDRAGVDDAVCAAQSLSSREGARDVISGTSTSEVDSRQSAVPASVRTAPRQRSRSMNSWIEYDCAVSTADIECLQDVRSGKRGS